MSWQCFDFCTPFALAHCRKSAEYTSTWYADFLHENLRAFMFVLAPAKLPNTGWVYSVDIRTTVDQ